MSTRAPKGAPTTAGGGRARRRLGFVQPASHARRSGRDVSVASVSRRGARGASGLAVHSCPACGQACWCDAFDDEGECAHDCDPEDLGDLEDDEDLDDVEGDNDEDW